MSDSNTSTVKAKPIKIAILAMGGEGGGVLAGWIVDMGEHNGWIAQTTSVPGVAQRTGATIYYVELFPREAAERSGRMPVLALMPAPGDVDVVLASELMEPKDGCAPARLQACGRNNASNAPNGPAS